ncbi:hypothetical protein BDV26DRAFT_276519 [Aspergillus bertholletiae]|uniref:Secreted protein n=1 Tax=Aspergillus bertholletiae TaxID=1226010 RepID=A0A5N7AR48_9EURO|nr:hypothetical protein BDV26DRAFT_276519 [Aspergillus bertholletiae]
MCAVWAHIYFMLLGVLHTLPSFPVSCQAAAGCPTRGPAYSRFTMWRPAIPDQTPLCCSRERDFSFFAYLHRL